MAINEQTAAQRIRELEAENLSLRQEAERLKAENRRWARMAGTDALTGLPNKISFMRALVPQTIQRAMAEGNPIGFILLSADDLGPVNETYGREAGDQILKGLGDLLQPLLGEEGRLGHIDGSHFAVVLYPADLDTVRGRANMLRARVRAHKFLCADTIAQITVSAGIASVEPNAASDGRILTEDVFRLLNQSLYLAKKAGGNRIEVVQDEKGKGKEASL